MKVKCLHCGGFISVDGKPLGDATKCFCFLPIIDEQEFKNAISQLPPGSPQPNAIDLTGWFNPMPPEFSRAFQKPLRDTSPEKTRADMTLELQWRSLKHTHERIFSGIDDEIDRIGYARHTKDFQIVIKQREES